MKRSNVVPPPQTDRYKLRICRNLRKSLTTYLALQAASAPIKSIERCGQIVEHYTEILENLAWREERGLHAS